jgi:hypothetical protein
MAIKFNRSQTFATNGTVTAAGLHNLIDGTDIYQALITDQTAMTSVGSLDKLLIADSDLTAADAPRSVTVNELFEDALTLSTYTNANAVNLKYTSATGNYTLSTGATITNGTITNGVITNGTITNGTIASGTIPTLTAGTTTSTNAVVTNGTVQTLTASTANISQGSAILTQGTIATLNSTTGTIGAFNSTTGTIATLNSTTGTIPTIVATTLVTTGTGTAAAPAIVPIGDTNTGIFFPAAETLAATTNGTERLRIASAGQIGIGGANYGTSGQVLTSAGASAAPSWQTIASLTSGTAVASTSGTAIDFTGIPSTAKRITVMLNGVSVSGTSSFLVQIGSGSITSSGYNSCSAGVINAAPPSVTTSTAGYAIASDTASDVKNGHMVITLMGSNLYVSSHTFGGDSTRDVVWWGGGSVTLAGTLDRVRITTVSGTDTFDAGSINIMYE